MTDSRQRQGLYSQMNGISLPSLGWMSMGIGAGSCTRVGVKGRKHFFASNRFWPADFFDIAEEILFIVIVRWISFSANIFGSIGRSWWAFELWRLISKENEIADGMLMEMTRKRRQTVNVRYRSVFVRTGQSRKAWATSNRQKLKPISFSIFHSICQSDENL